MAMVWTGFSLAKRAKWGTTRLPLCPTSLHALRITSHLDRWLFSEGHDLQILSRFYALKARHDCTIHSPQSILAPLSSLQVDTVPPTPLFLKDKSRILMENSLLGKVKTSVSSSLVCPPSSPFLDIYDRSFVDNTTRNYLVFDYCSETETWNKSVENQEDLYFFSCSSRR